VRDTSDRRDSTFAAVIDTSGQTLLGPDYLPEAFGKGDDFVNYPEGDVGWAYARGGKMRVVRVPLVATNAVRFFPRSEPRIGARLLRRDLLGRFFEPRRVRAAAKIVAAIP
jgi:hypothetical protein